MATTAGMRAIVRELKNNQVLSFLAKNFLPKRYAANNKRRGGYDGKANDIVGFIQQTWPQSTHISQDLYGVNRCDGTANHRLQKGRRGSDQTAVTRRRLAAWP